MTRLGHSGGVKACRVPSEYWNQKAGRIHAVAAVNPLTFVLTTGRSLLAGSPEDVAQAVAIAAALVAAFGLWALRGLRVAERAG